MSRVRAGEADPLDARHLVHLLEQAREVAGRVVWRLVVIDDLAEELDLAVSAGGRVADFGEDFGGRTHALVPAGVRHHAEGAELVAALDDVDVGLDGVRAAGNAERERHVLMGVDVDLRTDVLVERARHQHRQLLDLLRADDDVDEAWSA